MMRRNFFVIPVAVCIIILATSCKQMYFDTENISYITGKTHMKPFSHLNNPIVITMPVYQGKGLLGNDKLGHANKREGDIFVVYDWESDEIFDWAFFPGMHGLSNWRAVELGTPVKYYDAGEGSGLIGCLNPEDGKVTTIKAEKRGHLLNMNSNNDSIRPRYGLIPSVDYRDGIDYRRINILDTEIQQYNPRFIEFPNENINVGYSYLDSNFNYWIMIQNDEKNYLGRLDCDKLELEKYYITEMSLSEIDGRATCDAFSIHGIVNDYAILSDGVEPLYENFIICNLSNPSVDKFEIPVPKRISENDFLLRTVFVSGEAYCLFINDDDGVYDMIYHLNPETWEFEYEATFQFVPSETIYARGSRIYLLNSWNTEQLYCVYYDIETKKVSDEILITFEEIVKGEY